MLSGVNKSKSNIYIDLDDTLVRNVKCEWNDPNVDFSNDRACYSCYVNPCASTLLEHLRRCCFKVTLFTFGARSYAEKTNYVAKLGFESEDVIAREDYIFPVCDARGELQEWRNLMFNTDSSGVLIDDFPIDHAFPAFKRAHLGIEQDRQVRYTPFEKFDSADPFGNWVAWHNDCVVKTHALIRELDGKLGI